MAKTIYKKGMMVDRVTLWTRVKRLGTLLTTEEVFNEDGTSQRVRRVLRAGRM